MHDDQTTTDRERTDIDALASTLPAVLIQAAGRYKQNPFVVTPSRTLSYGQTLEMSQRLAHRLCEAGLKPGERVALLLPNDWPFIIAIFAVMMSRGIVVPLDPRIRPATFGQIRRDCGIRALIGERAALDRLRSMLDDSGDPIVICCADHTGTARQSFRQAVYSLESIVSRNVQPLSSLPIETNSDTVVSINYTSGSTGMPKGVMHSHRSWLASAAFTASYFELRAGDSMVIPLPLRHAYGFRHLLAYMMSGARVFLSDGLLEALQHTQDTRPNALLLVPDTCRILVKEFKDQLRNLGPWLKFVSVGTGTISSEPIQRLREILENALLHIPYGLTEARVGFLRVDDDPSRRRLCAIAPGLQVRVVDADGRAVECGQTGEIVIQGDGLMLGYWNSSEQERRELVHFGFRTGDRGLVTEKGEIALLGRIDEMIKVAGRKVHPAEVENVLNKHPAVAESAVMAISDPSGIAEVRLEATAVLHKDAAASEAALIKHCKAHLEAYKVPTAIVFAAALPRTSTGKIVRNRNQPLSVQD